MPTTHTPSHTPNPNRKSQGIWPKALISTKAASIPTSVPSTRHTPLPITPPWTGLMTSSTLEAAA
ncbi:hypothetical protein D3C73_1458210 [compost metagenome]